MHAFRGQESSAKQWPIIAPCPYALRAENLGGGLRVCRRKPTEEQCAVFSPLDSFYAVSRKDSPLAGSGNREDISISPLMSPTCEIYLLEIARNFARNFARKFSPFFQDTFSFFFLERNFKFLDPGYAKLEAKGGWETLASQVIQDQSSSSMTIVYRGNSTWCRCIIATGTIVWRHRPQVLMRIDTRSYRPIFGQQIVYRYLKSSIPSILSIPFTPSIVRVFNQPGRRRLLQPTDCCICRSDYFWQTPFLDRKFG